MDVPLPDPTIFIANPPPPFNPLHVGRVPGSPEHNYSPPPPTMKNENEAEQLKKPSGEWGSVALVEVEDGNRKYEEKARCDTETKIQNIFGPTREAQIFLFFVSLLHNRLDICVFVSRISVCN